ncbi:MAG: thiosulfate oxidation carrier protein SoxY [Limnobacter sp.]|nr:thiosulfate oxidation carrier protein SoxY [Limnobacter sp.]
MNEHRRSVLKAGAQCAVLGLAWSAGLFRAGSVFAAQGWNAAAFKARTLEEVLAALGENAPVESRLIQLDAPDIAEDGSKVSVSVSSQLPGTTELALLVPHNPAVLAALFVFGQGTLPQISTRIKLRETSLVYALVKANEGLYFARKEVRVTLGGCFG